MLLNHNVCVCLYAFSLVRRKVILKARSLAVAACLNVENRYLLLTLYLEL